MRRTFRSGIAVAALAISIGTAAAAHEAGQAAPAAGAGTAESELAKPPAGAETLLITSPGGRHGQTMRWTDKDGTRWARESLLLRGFKTEVDQQTRLAPDGTISALTIRGSTPQGSAAESFQMENGRYAFTSPVDKGGSNASPGLFYIAYGGLAEPSILLAEALIKAPGRTLTLAPSGKATLNPLTELNVKHNGQSKRLTAYTLDGVGLSPQPIWFERDKVFGVASFLNFLPAGWEGAAPQLSKAQDEALAKRAPALLARVAPRQSGPIVFSNVRLYDADSRTFRENMTVVAEGGKITAVAASGAATVPAGATTLDGTGKTLVPGLWDSHQHYFDDGSGPLLLSLGITSVRDPGNRPEESIARKQRIDTGQLLGPRIISVMLIDGPGPLAAQMAVTASDPASALAAVRKAKQMGFTGVKLYGSLDPKLVPVIAGEAKKLGLRVQGHVPRTMRPLEAVRAGYDELTHINFVAMQAMPDSVVNESNGLQRFYGPGRYAANVDWKSPEMRAYIAELARRGTAVDPTLAIFEGGFKTEPGELAPSYTPFQGILPPTVDRGFRTGGFAPTPDVPREQFRKSFPKLLELVVALHRAGVPIVAGTDGSGMELIRDLELYVEGGLSPGEALATATIIPAKAFGVAGDRGSIAVGNTADLVLVDGDPSKRIGDLRKVDTVLLGDRLMKGDALRAAAGLSGRPK
ncbi:MAG TPA: amidohydrolase family protein [Allosphingosinicella sp.]